MSRFLRIRNNTIHVPSLANASIETGCFGFPSLTLDFHGQPRKTISYTWKTYDDCEKDLIKVKAAMQAVEQSLASIPLTSPSEKVEEKAVELVTPQVTTNA